MTNPDAHLSETNFESPRASSPAGTRYRVRIWDKGGFDWTRTISAPTHARAIEWGERQGLQFGKQPLRFKISATEVK